MKKKFLIRVDYNDKVGLGHVYRSINLGQLLIKYKHEITILIKKEKKINLVKNKKINFIFLKKNITLIEETNLILKMFKNKKYDYLILDIDNFYCKKTKYEKYLSKLKNIMNKTICWDNIISNKFNFALTYRPYPDYLNLKKLKKKQKILSGLQYLYYPYKKITNKNGRKSILINMGATIKNKTLKDIISVINSIKLNHKLNIKIVNAKLKKNLMKIRHHNFTILKRTLRPNVLYNKIDLAIVSGGMSKFECMLNSIPCIVINLNKDQSRINKRLNYKKLCLVVDNISLLNKKLKILITNKKLRREIKNNCYKISKKFEEKKLVNKLTNL